MPYAWADLMAFGLGTLGLAPAEFWTMTPRELNAALIGVFGHPSAKRTPARTDLTALMKRYPDA